MNNFSCIGRLGKDAELRSTSDNKVTSFSAAVDSGFGAKKHTLWLDCSLWGKRAESIVGFLKKGAQVGLIGELGTKIHEGKTYLTLRVSEVSLLGGKPAATAQG